MMTSNQDGNTDNERYEKIYLHVVRNLKNTSNIHMKWETIVAYVRPLEVLVEIKSLPNKLFGDQR